MAYATLSEKQKERVAPVVPIWAHSDYDHWSVEWAIIRDCFMGERLIKEKTECYLPRMDGMDKNDYKAYLDRATFYNMTARTVTGLLGQLFRRAPVLSGIPDRITAGMKHIWKDGSSFEMGMKAAAHEVIEVGRHGVLVDLPTEGGNGVPYFAPYLAENIIDWKTDIDPNGRTRVTEVWLREIREDIDIVNGLKHYRAEYRALKLESTGPAGRMEYRQYVYTKPDADADITSEPSAIIEPMRRGQMLDFIPFVFFGPFSNNPDIEKPPLIDIAQMNLSHYRSYAHLEHGRFFTGLPVYYCPVSSNDGNGEYTIGPSVVWEVENGQKPGILEFNGQGLKHLENALDQKEQHVAALGGKLLGIRGQAVSESDNQVMIQERNEQAVLLNISLAMDRGASNLLAWWAWWQDVPMEEAEEIDVEFNKEFLLTQIGARELRAVAGMYKDGHIPIEVLYDYLRRAEVVPEWMDMDEFQRLLDTVASFPNNPDIEAKQEGFPDKKTQLDEQRADKDARLNAQIQRLQGLMGQNQSPATPPNPQGGGNAT